MNAPSTLQPSGPPVEVMVRTDAPSGELFVNGQTYGDITSDEDVLIELPPAPTASSCVARTTCSRPPR